MIGKKKKRTSKTGTWGKSCRLHPSQSLNSLQVSMSKTMSSNKTISIRMINSSKSNRLTNTSTTKKSSMYNRIRITLKTSKYNTITIRLRSMGNMTNDCINNSSSSSRILSTDLLLTMDIMQNNNKLTMTMECQLSIPQAILSLLRHPINLKIHSKWKKSLKLKEV